jgi:tRNA (cytidine/uridine-2'-O-)-methyltransferase
MQALSRSPPNAPPAHRCAGSARVCDRMPEAHRGRGRHADMKIVLVAPEIPGNTGTIGRTCVALDMELILIRPYGFELSDKTVRRAGLDYWKHVRLQEYDRLGGVHRRPSAAPRITAVPVRGRRSGAGTVFDRIILRTPTSCSGAKRPDLPPALTTAMAERVFACRCSARISARSTSPTRSPRLPIRPCAPGSGLGRLPCEMNRFRQVFHRRSRCAFCARTIQTA